MIKKNFSYGFVEKKLKIIIENCFYHSLDCCERDYTFWQLINYDLQTGQFTPSVGYKGQADKNLWAYWEIRYG